MDLGFVGKAAFVMASTQGLGLAVARSMAQNGCRVAICGRKASRAQAVARELAHETGAEVIGFGCDVREAAQIEEAINGAIESFGGLDILITNAGGPPAGGFDAVPDRAWKDSFEALIMSVVRAVRLVTPVMRNRGGGRVVCIASTSVRETLPGMALSNTFRPAIAGLAKSLSQELGGSGILVNTVLPGALMTQRNKDLATAAAASEGRSVDEVVASWASGVPVGRMGRPEEFGDVVAFLASPRNSFVTGALIGVEGGIMRAL